MRWDEEEASELGMGLSRILLVVAAIWAVHAIANIVRRHLRWHELAGAVLIEREDYLSYCTRAWKTALLSRQRFFVDLLDTVVLLTAHFSRPPPRSWVDFFYQLPLAT